MNLAETPAKRIARLDAHRAKCRQRLGMKLFRRKHQPPGASYIPRHPLFRAGKTYKPNGARECERRNQQLVRGMHVAPRTGAAALTDAGLDGRFYHRAVPSPRAALAATTQ